MTTAVSVQPRAMATEESDDGSASEAAQVDKPPLGSGQQAVPELGDLAPVLEDQAHEPQETQAAPRELGRNAPDDLDGVSSAAEAGVDVAPGAVPDTAAAANMAGEAEDKPASGEVTESLAELGPEATKPLAEFGAAAAAAGDTNSAPTAEASTDALSSADALAGPRAAQAALQSGAAFNLATRAKAQSARCCVPEPGPLHVPHWTGQKKHTPEVGPQIATDGNGKGCQDADSVLECSDSPVLDMTAQLYSFTAAREAGFKAREAGFTAREAEVLGLQLMTGAAQSYLIGPRRSRSRYDLNGRYNVDGRSDVGSRSNLDGRSHLNGKFHSEGRFDLNVRCNVDGSCDVGGRQFARADTVQALLWRGPPGARGMGAAVSSPNTGEVAVPSLGTGGAPIIGTKSVPGLVTNKAPHPGTKMVPRLGITAVPDRDTNEEPSLGGKEKHTYIMGTVTGTDPTSRTAETAAAEDKAVELAGTVEVVGTAAGSVAETAVAPTAAAALEGLAALPPVVSTPFISVTSPEGAEAPAVTASPISVTSAGDERAPVSRLGRAVSATGLRPPRRSSRRNFDAPQVGCLLLDTRAPA
jgi:hypothetical protein